MRRRSSSSSQKDLRVGSGTGLASAAALAPAADVVSGTLSSRLLCADGLTVQWVIPGRDTAEEVAPAALRLQWSEADPAAADGSGGGGGDALAAMLGEGAWTMNWWCEGNRPTRARKVLSVDPHGTSRERVKVLALVAAQPAEVKTTRRRVRNDDGGEAAAEATPPPCDVAR